MAAKLLDRLERVLQTGDSQWRARCPAHDGRSRTLSVRELDDGRVLLHCFAQCTVLAAIGLQTQDLFPKRPSDHQPRRRTGMPAREALALIDHECTVALRRRTDAAPVPLRRAHQLSARPVLPGAPGQGGSQ